jgi:hypothetical protein
MQKDDEQCLRLGREMLRIITDVLAVETGTGRSAYGRRGIVVGPEQLPITVFVVAGQDLADFMETAVDRGWAVDRMPSGSEAVS